MAKPVGVQATAHARAKVLGIVHKGRAAGLEWCQIAPQIKTASLGEVPCEQTVNRWFKRVEGIDPTNWARALAPDYKWRTARAPMSEAAWDEFCALVAAWGLNGTGANLKKAWAEVAEKKAKQGWVWPPYVTEGATASGCIGVGRASDTFDNSVGAAGDLRCEYRTGVFGYANHAADLVTQADVGKLCDIVDDQTVAKTHGGNTRSPAGYVDGIEGGTVWVRRVEALTKL